MYLGSKRPRDAAVEEDVWIQDVTTHVAGSTVADATHAADIKTNQDTIGDHATLHVAHAAQFTTHSDAVTRLGKTESSTLTTGGAVTHASTTYSVAAGTGHIAGLLVTWADDLTKTSAFMVSDEFTYVAINASGVVVEQKTPWTGAELVDLIPLAILHHYGATITEVVNTPSYSSDVYAQTRQFMELFGVQNIDGNVITDSGSPDLKISKTAGNLFALGRNFVNDAKNPNVVATGALASPTLQFMFQDGSLGTPGDEIRPTEYDDGSGAGSPGTVGAGEYSAMRVYVTPGNVIYIAPGQEVYSTAANARWGAALEPFVVADYLKKNACLRGIIIPLSTATDVGHVLQASILSS